jgi:hypothetical protein
VVGQPGDGVTFTGNAQGEGRRRMLAFTTDAAAALAAYVAAPIGAPPGALVLDGEPTLKAAIGRRTSIAGTVRIAGGSTVRVKLAGRLAVPPR